MVSSPFLYVIPGGQEETAAGRKMSPSVQFPLRSPTTADVMRFPCRRLINVRINIMTCIGNPPWKRKTSGGFAALPFAMPMNSGRGQKDPSANRSMTAISGPVSLDILFFLGLTGAVNDRPEKVRGGNERHRL